MPFIIGIGVLIGLVAGAAAYLRWQANVSPADYEELFVVPPDDEEKRPSSSHNGSRRVVALEGAANFRDVGGYLTTDGKRVRWGRLFRADRLDKLTDADLETLEAMGIKVVCDFRMPSELELMGDRLPQGVAHKHMPVFEKDPVGRVKVMLNRHRLTDLFAGVYTDTILPQGGQVYGDLVRLLGDEANLPVVFHCTAGKDRTGVAAAVILLALGVPRDVVIADYLLTNRAAETFIEGVRVQLGARNVRGITVEQLYPLLAAAPRYIEEALAYIDEHHGSAEGYLRQAGGVTDEEMTRFRAVMLEDPT